MGMKSGFPCLKETPSPPPHVRTLPIHKRFHTLSPLWLVRLIRPPSPTPFVSLILAGAGGALFAEFPVPITGGVHTLFPHASD